MTVKQAHEALKRRLSFGDTEQVDAVIFLRRLDIARERVAHCKHCDGEGLDRAGYACPWCAAHYEPDILHALAIGARERPA